MKVIDTIALLLVIIGAINWGLIGFFDYDLVSSIFGYMSIISRIIFSAVGICGLYCISLLFRSDNCSND
ncbi:hypothetical protein SAMN02745248_00544 [Hathewaya proteolytica DSM 3090]|uniref:DUF378 domain-containing protein n=1 Tax=Hathewaya proteolytica DSM 3090 TaxID=1121331 RepID=A0A1M6KP65_9CLOT|nr:DUF378 domain-containing protein [Hathewaya proteolytica]SHJ60644.1 hypothetical protein SAMN02745248_00544 [Hathewaya proteolytica DSM 3090]